MDPNDEHLLVVGTVEDPDPPALGKPGCRAPEKVVLELLGARLLEAEDLTALRIDPGHDVPDRTVLAGRVHPLEDQQERISVGRVVEALERAQLGDVFSQQFPIVLVRRGGGVDARRPLVEVDLVSGSDPEVVRVDLHLDPFGTVRPGCMAPGAPPPSIGSSLPPDLGGFQRNGNAVEVRDDARRVRTRRAARRHSRAVHVAARRAGQLADALHLLPRDRAARGAIGEELDPHRRGVEVVEEDLDLEDMLRRAFRSSDARSAAGPISAASPRRRSTISGPAPASAARQR